MMTLLLFSLFAVPATAIFFAWMRINVIRPTPGEWATGIACSLAAILMYLFL